MTSGQSEESITYGVMAVLAGDERPSLDPGAANLDKHRTPVAVGVTSSATFSLSETTVTADPDDPDWYVISSQPAVEVTTHDGRPRHATLREIVIAVYEAVGSFSDVLPYARSA